jgi:hypothetical protein
MTGYLWFDFGAGLRRGPWCDDEVLDDLELDPWSDLDLTRAHVAMLARSVRCCANDHRRRFEQLKRGTAQRAVHGLRADWLNDIAEALEGSRRARFVID